MLKQIIVASVLALFSSGPAGAGGGCYTAPYPSGAAITGRLDCAGVFRRRPSLRGAKAPHGGFE
jgi:hypothetical protein